MTSLYRLLGCALLFAVAVWAVYLRYIGLI